MSISGLTIRWRLVQDELQQQQEQRASFVVVVNTTIGAVLSKVLVIYHSVIERDNLSLFYFISIRIILFQAFHGRTSQSRSLTVFFKQQELLSVGHLMWQ